MNMRPYIKNKAKDLMTNNYWVNVGIIFVVTLITGAISFVFEGKEIFFKILSYAERIIYRPHLSSYAILAIYVGTAFISLPLMSGLYKHFSEVYRGNKPAFSTTFVSAFKENYLRKVGGICWMYLFTFLWYLLFIIPGIIKYYSYAMTPYILARFPNVKAKDALKLSMKLMHGKKGDLFVFQLSFYGWYLLSACTLGILSVFFVNPYYFTAVSGFFEEIVASSLSNGTISMEDLGEGTYYEI